MAKGKEDVKQETKLADSSKNTLNSILKDNKSEHFNFHERKHWNASTGSLILDAATGGVSPSLWRLAGKSNAGKTPQMLEILRNIFITVPKSKGLWVIAEGRGLSEENVSRCGLKLVYKPEDWDYGTVFVLETKIFELVIKTIQDLILNNPDENIYGIVIDSLDGLILRDDAAKPIEAASKVAGTPMLSKKMLQSLSLGMFKFGHFMGIISQKTTEIKLDTYAPGADRGGNFSGGNSLFHGSDVILEYHNQFNGDFILDNPSGKFNDGKTKTIGVNVNVTLAKSAKESTKKTKIVYPVKYGRKPSGIWIERELGDFALGWGLLTRAGAGWLTFEPGFHKELTDKGFVVPEKVQGMDNLFEIFEHGAELTKYLTEKFKTLIS